jgi:hypothetical protein
MNATPENDDGRPAVRVPEKQARFAQEFSSQEY